MSKSKLREATSPEDDECALDMSPMIDMVFLLLIFFIVNATAIIVQTDPEVEPPKAVNSKSQEVADGRIVINVRKDGTFTDEAFVILPGEDAIRQVVEKQRKECEAVGFDPRLHLRGHKDAIFKYGRTAIRAAAEAGVSQVVFAVYPR